MPRTPVPAAAPGLPFEPEAHELDRIDPTYCDGLAWVAASPNGVAKLAFYLEERGRRDGSITRVVVVKIALPHASLVEAATRILATAGQDGKLLAPAWSTVVGGRA